MEQQPFDKASTVSSAESLRTPSFGKLRTQKRARWFRPGDWPIFVKTLLGTVAVVALALGVTTFVNARTLQTDLREEIGAEFESLASAQMSHLVDILSEQLAILRSIALIDQVKEGAATANARYSGDQAAIEAQLLAIDEQWVAAADDSQLVQSIVDPQSNRLTLQLLDYMESFPDHVEIFLTDRYGGLLAATGRTSDYYQADEGWWQVAYNDGRGAYYIGQPEYDESAGYTALNMAAPILSEESGEVIGVARTTFRVDAIYQAVGRVQFGETGHVTVIDSSGLVVADPRPERVGAQVPPSWGTPEMLQMASHWHELVDEEGVPILAGHAAISGIEIEHKDEAKAIQSLGWVLFAAQSQAEAYAPVASATRTGLLAAGVFALVAAGLAFVVARTVVTPITDLLGVARQMAAGDLSARARLRRRDETGELAEAFNSMADEVTEMVGTLEQRVAERTAELERRAVQLTTAAEVSRAASSILDLEELLSRTVDLIADRFDLYYAGLFLLDEAGEWAVLQAGTSDAGRQMLAQGHRLEVGGVSMVGWCTANAQARIALDVGEEAVRFDNLLLPDTRSEIALPLISRGRVVGALDVQSTEEAAFTDEDVAVLQTMADQLANAIENARLFQQTQESLEAERRAYGELSRQAWEELLRAWPDLGERYDPQGILPTDGPWREEMRLAALEGKTVLGEPPFSSLPPGGAEGGATLATPIKVRDQVIGVLDAHKPASASEWTAEEIALMETLTEQLGVALESARLYQDTQRRAARERLTGEVTARVRETLDVDTVLQTAAREMREALNLAEAEVRMGIGPVSSEARPPATTLEIPIKVRGQVIGVIDVHRSDGEGEWTQEQVTLLETLADQLGQALEAAQLYQDAQQLAAREQLIAQVTARMRETLDVDTVLQTAARELREALSLAEAEVRMGTGLPSGEA